MNYVFTKEQLEQLVDRARRDAGTYSTLNVSNKSRARAWRRSVVKKYLADGNYTAPTQD